MNGVRCARRFATALCQRRLMSKEGSSRPSGADTGVLDGYHFTPLGESDLSQRSRVSMLSTEMLESKMMGVRGLSSHGFRLIDGTFVYGPVALFPKTVLSWRVLTPDDITPRSLCLFTMLEPKIDILVLGCGDKKNIDKIRARVAPYLREHKIGLEIMDTEDAIATFNFLNAEKRYVGAALYPPDEMVVTDAEYARAMNLLKGWDELPENPMFLGIGDSINQTEDLVKRLWNGEGNWNLLQKKLLSAPEERKLRQLQEKKEKETKKIDDK